MDKKTAAELVDRYIALWNERDTRALLQEVFTSNATYVDPNVSVTGAPGIGEYISAARRNFAGMTFTHGTVLAHHDVAHFAWQVGPDGGPSSVSGFDVVQFEGDRISRLHGFFNGY